MGEIRIPRGEAELLAVWRQACARPMWQRVAAGEGDGRELAGAELAALPAPLDALGANAELVSQLTGRRWYVIRDAVETGATWPQVAAALGTSPAELRAWYRQKIAAQAEHVPGHDALRAAAVLDADREWDTDPVTGAVADLLVRHGASREDADRWAEVLLAAGLVLSPDSAADMLAACRAQAEAEARAAQGTPHAAEAYPGELAFFRPGRTYARQHSAYTAPEMIVQFRVEHVTRHPQGGHLRAIGWMRTGAPGATWHGYYQDRLTGWSEITGGDR